MAGFRSSICCQIASCSNQIAQNVKSNQIESLFPQIKSLPVQIKSQMASNRDLNQIAIWFCPWLIGGVVLVKGLTYNPKIPCTCEHETTNEWKRRLITCKHCSIITSVNVGPDSTNRVSRRSSYNNNNGLFHICSAVAGFDRYDR